MFGIDFNTVNTTALTLQIAGIIAVIALLVGIVKMLFGGKGGGSKKSSRQAGRFAKDLTVMAVLAGVSLWSGGLINSHYPIGGWTHYGYACAIFATGGFMCMFMGGWRPGRLAGTLMVVAALLCMPLIFMTPPP